jgi:hypothetical protein
VKVSFLSLAQNELDDAVAWYNEQTSGLGIEFLGELDRARSAGRDFSSVLRVTARFTEEGNGMCRCVEHSSNLTR